MKAIPSQKLSLTRSRVIEAVCWALVLAAALVARYFPVRQMLPLPLRVGIGIVLGILAVIIVAVSLGFVTEKGDERSMDNDRKANSTLFTLFFLLMGALLVFGKDGRVYAVGQSELLVIFAVVCLAKDLVFLGYEKFGT